MTESTIPQPGRWIGSYKPGTVSDNPGSLVYVPPYPRTFWERTLVLFGLAEIRPAMFVEVKPDGSD